MDEWKRYIFSIIAAAMISSVSVSITAKMGAVGKIVKLLCGVFILITLISPILDLPDINISNYISNIEIDAEDIVEQGQNLAAEETARIIKSQSEAYILDMAAQMGLAIDVDISLSESSPMIPVSVSISGDVSPYLKRQLQQQICTNLGIQEEYQIWH